MGGSNQAINVNPFVVNNSPVAIHITRRGSDWYWAVTALMGLTFILILATGFRRPGTHRIFHHILTAAALVATIVYFCMASNLGWVPINVEFHRHNHTVAGSNRQIWYVRYIGWFLYWPLLTLATLLTTAAPAANIFWTCFLTCVMPVMALVGALVHSTYKWGFYTFWVVTWIIIGYHLIFAPRRYANALGNDVRRTHGVTSGWIWFLWMLYPICWGVSEGGNVIAPDSEFIFYGILDILLIPVTAAFFLWSHRTIDPARLGLYMRNYDDPIRGTSSGYTDGEKRGVTNGHTHSATTGPTTGPTTGATNGVAGTATTAV